MYFFTTVIVIITIFVTVACDCHSFGSLNVQCNVSTGQCPCTPGSEGRQCDTCKSGFFNVSEGCLGKVTSVILEHAAYILLLLQLVSVMVTPTYVMLYLVYALAVKATLKVIIVSSVLMATLEML